MFSSPYKGALSPSTCASVIEAQKLPKSGEKFMVTAKGQSRPFFLFNENEMKNYFLAFLKKIT